MIQIKAKQLRNHGIHFYLFLDKRLKVHKLQNKT